MTGKQLKIQVYYWLGIGAYALLGGWGASAQISLSSVADLATRNSPQVKSATADVERAKAGLAEAKDVFIPNLVTGASPGPPSIGFPLGQPSLFNVTSQSLIYSFSQADYIHASRAALKSAELNLKDTREQVILESALAYIQLDTDTRELTALSEEKTDAERLVSLEGERLAAGVDTRMEDTKAQITSAQIDVKRLHIENDASEQRQKLANLTGLPPASFITDSKSVPQLPNFSEEDIADQALTSNAGIQAAYQNAQSKRDVSRGDSKQIYRPQFAFGAEYSRFAPFENYSDYYLKFTDNNFGAAVEITFPLFDATRRAKARESAAEANRAQFEADRAKNQANEQTISLRHTLSELRAQQHLAHLQSQYAQEQLETVQEELKDGTGSPNAAPVTPKEAELASIQSEERYQDALDADLSLTRTQLNLMRSTGGLEDWLREKVVSRMPESEHPSPAF